MKETRIQTGKQNTPLPAKVATAPPLAENEWNFDSVPPKELEVCCYWEYARESAFIQRVREIWRRTAGCKLDEATLPESLTKDWKKMSFALYRAGHGGKACLFRDEILPVGGKSIASPFPEAWQSLRPEVRQILRDTAGDSSQKMPPFRWSDHFALHVMAESLPIPNMEIEPKVGFLPPFGLKKDPKLSYPKPAMEAGMQEKFWENKPRAERPSMLWRDGEETLLIAIQWGFSTADIIKCFTQWVKVHRPKDFEGPDTRGKKENKWRVALERLGVMRAMNAYENPDGDFLETIKTGAKRNRRLDHRRAGETFRELFPFLPQGEEPIHWQVKGDQLA
jgi:hypothetical protein